MNAALQTDASLQLAAIRDLHQDGQVDQALAQLRLHLQANPAHIEALQLLGSWLADQGHALEGAHFTCEAYVLQPAQQQPPRMRGIAYYLLGRLDEAAEVYRRWLQEEPGNATAQHFLAACTGQATPSRASDAFVRQSFDDYADRFDTVLRGLGYRIPEHIRDWLSELTPALRQWDVLDGGCGTGLAGALLAPWARRLYGVDLSPGMLARAAQTGVYDDLQEGELGAYLAQFHEAFDLIALADTLIYFGDLGDVLVRCANALRGGGYVVFNTEQFEGQDLQLAPSGRYQHSAAHVHQALIRAGFELVREQSLAVRHELGQEVAGQLVLARRSG
jgi:predicted TPR repeat methyltransferase